MVYNSSDKEMAVDSVRNFKSLDPNLENFISPEEKNKIMN